MKTISPASNLVLPLFSCHLSVEFDGATLVSIVLSEINEVLAKSAPSDDPLLFQLAQQIQLYQQNPSHQFQLTTELQGTDFQKRVWNHLLTIPAGQVKTYGQVSDRVGGSAIAVGQALKRNPIPVIFPCHRVVAKGGIGGFSGSRDGWQLQFKKELLKHEGYCGKY
jgi:methylated-DNA-[protein]-cysteine S-methyltransferase